MGTEHRADVVIVGSGVGGMVAALKARAEGLDPLVVEKSPFVGGTSSISGGVLWIPANPLMVEAGVEDSFERAMTYMEAAIGDPGPATSRARKEAYVREGARMVTFLRELGLEFVYVDGWPDYYPELPGGQVRGRSLNVALFDTRRLGGWQGWLRPRDAGGIKFDIPLASMSEVPDMAMIARTVAGKRTLLRVLGRMLRAKATGARPVGMGQALMGRLLLAAQEQGVRIWRAAPLVDLVMHDGGVTGVVVERDGREVTVRADHGVLLCAGGFSRNGAMRKQYGREPASGDWTLVVPEDMGDAISIATAHGAGTALLEEATWTPASVLPDGSPVAHLWERAVPGSIIVDSSGARFCNEAASYMEVGRRIYERHETVPAVPSWMIIDSRHRRRYPFGTAPPGLTPRTWITTGYMKQAGTIPELARACGIDAGGLVATVERFNRMAIAGTDEDFHRGDSAYDRFYGDPTRQPNPCLGPVDRAPFSAVAIYPSDVGTCGGLLTDEHARVLRTNGTPLEGLYAAGNTTAGVMGHVYPGGGAALGPSATFGFIAARHMAGGC